MKLEIIKEIVCKNLRISEEDIFKKTRKKEIMEARHLFRYFAKKYTKKTLLKIAKFTNCKEHASVINSIKKVECFVLYDKDFKKKFKKIEAEILYFEEIPIFNSSKELTKFKRKLIDLIVNANTKEKIKDVLINFLINK